MRSGPKGGEGDVSLGKQAEWGERVERYDDREVQRDFGLGVVLLQTLLFFSLDFAPFPSCTPSILFKISGLLGFSRCFDLSLPFSVARQASLVFAFLPEDGRGLFDSLAFLRNKQAFGQYLFA